MGDGMTDSDARREEKREEGKAKDESIENRLNTVRDMCKEIDLLEAEIFNHSTELESKQARLQELKDTLNGYLK